MGNNFEFTAMLMPYITAVIILLIIFITKLYRDRSRNQVLMKSLETGKELPQDIFKDPESNKKNDPMTSALILIGTGIGLFVALYFFFGGLKFASFGFIPFCIGLGQLVAYFVTKNKNDKNL
jgi:amino acid transporter